MVDVHKPLKVSSAWWEVWSFVLDSTRIDGSCVTFFSFRFLFVDQPGRRQQLLKDQPGALTKFLHAVNWVDMEESCSVQPLVVWTVNSWREWHWMTFVCDRKIQPTKVELDYHQFWDIPSLGCDCECDSQQQTTGGKGLIINTHEPKKTPSGEKSSHRTLRLVQKMVEDTTNRVVLQNGHWFSGPWVNQPPTNRGKLTNQHGHFQPILMGKFLNEPTGCGGSILLGPTNWIHLASLKLTVNSSHLKIGRASQKETTVVFESSIFRGYVMLVSGRVTGSTKTSQLWPDSQGNAGVSLEVIGVL